jgi:hypothetical protein
MEHHMVRTKQQALAEARKRWGKNAMVRDNGAGAATTPEGRADGKRRCGEHQQKKAPEFRSMSDTTAWPDTATFGEYRSAWKAWRKERELWQAEAYRLQRLANGRRYTVGYVMGGLAFKIEGEGDTWQEAFDAAR